MRTLALDAARTRRVELIGAVGFAVAIAAASQIAIPLPGTPVPLTLQPMLVVLAGLWLGPRYGALGMMMFLAAGAAGLPVFAPGGLPGVARFMGPTGGYLLAYPLAAFAAGWVATRVPNFPGRLLASFAGFAALFAGGVTQLAILTGSWTNAVAVGLVPFIVPDLAKVVVAALLAPRRRPAGS